MFIVASGVPGKNVGAGVGGCGDGVGELVGGVGGATVGNFVGNGVGAFVSSCCSSSSKHFKRPYGDSQPQQSNFVQLESTVHAVVVKNWQPPTQMFAVVLQEEL